MASITDSIQMRMGVELLETFSNDLQHTEL